MVGVCRPSFDVYGAVVATDTPHGWGLFLEDGDGKHDGVWVAM
jgi:hypothetical protein